MSDLYGSPMGGGLMGMFANPQTAGLLGMAGGLLQASGPTRLPVSNGQAIGMGLAGIGQGMNNALQMQRGLMQMQAMQGLLGTPGQQQASGAPASPSYSSLFGPASSAPASMPAAAPATPSATPAAAGTIYGRTPQQLFQQGMLMNMAGIQGGGDLMRVAVEHDPTLAAQMPTDATKMATQAGKTPQEIQQANADALYKSLASTIRPGGGVNVGGRFVMTPSAAPAGYMNTQNVDGSWSVVPVAGGPDAVKGSAAAGAIGKAYGTNTTGYVGGKPTYVNQGQLSDQLVGGGAGVPGFTPFQNAIRAVETGGNPFAVNPASGASGSMQTMGPTLANPGFGVMPARDNSPAEKQRVGADYAAAMQSRYGNDTDAAVAYNWGPDNADKWIAAGRPWNMLPKETQSYVGQVHAQMQNFAGGGAGAQRNTLPTPELPPGAAAAANASQGAPSEQMKTAYGALSNADANYQASKEALQAMLHIAQNGGVGDTVARLLPGNVATRMSNDAAEYEKAHANYVALQGKALGAAGTDASRATLEAAVPTFDKPQQAKIQGLTNQLQQLDLSHLKTQFLQPIYQAGDEKAYSKANAGFDQNITPQMTPILQMSGPQQRAAVQAAIKLNPALRSKFEWAFNNGMLK